VLVDFDHRIGAENVSRITGIDPASVLEIILHSNLQTDYESGKISSKTFTQKFNQESNCQVSEPDLLNAVSDIFTLNRPIVPLLTQLRSARFPIGILSNTCEAHWNFIVDQNPLLNQFFEPQNCVLSFQVSCLKPDPAIYEHARQVAQVPARNIFFCDDLIRNVEGATAASFQARPFTSTQKLIRDLLDLNVKINL